MVANDHVYGTGLFSAVAKFEIFISRAEDDPFRSLRLFMNALRRTKMVRSSVQNAVSRILATSNSAGPVAPLSSLRTRMLPGSAIALREYASRSHLMCACFCRWPRAFQACGYDRPVRELVSREPGTGNGE